MAADTKLTLTGRMPIENNQAPGVFGITSRFGAGSVIVTYSGPQGSETVFLRNAGDSLTLNLLNIDSLSIEADSYPADILILQSSTPSAVLTAAPVVTIGSGVQDASGMSGTQAVAAATITGTTAIDPDKRYSMESFFVSWSLSASSRVTLTVGGVTVLDVIGTTKGTAERYLGGSVVGALGGPIAFTATADTGTITGSYTVLFNGYVITG